MKGTIHMEHKVWETKTLIKNEEREDYSLFGSFPDDCNLLLSIRAD